MEKKVSKLIIVKTRITKSYMKKYFIINLYYIDRSYINIIIHNLKLRK